MLLTACSGFVSRFMRFCVDVLDMAVIGGGTCAVDEEDALGAVLVEGTATGGILEGCGEAGV